MDFVVLGKMRRDRLKLHHKHSHQASKTVYCITLPITLEKYREIVGDHRAFRAWIDEMIIQHAELLPNAIRDGYTRVKQNDNVTERDSYSSLPVSVRMVG